ncbi:MAG: RNA polymerase sigma-70 factor [Bacteroidales bacterium]|jgi:RNA polymerase sigma-70 factor (ECF subfamily)|nr:RNA polymerase sigma-70 factor [Bacteroidales bacterium]MCI2133739.1 RNA polymerase sigma-70 factor [Bacteroidales bacterium]
MDANTIYVRQLSDGDKNAFEILFLKYQPKVITFLSGFLQDKELAHDMAQDIFFKVWQDRAKLSNVKSFQSYIFSMAHNAMCNYFKHSLVREKYDLEQMLRPIIASNPEESMFANELQDLVNLKVEQMPEKRKRIFKMSRSEGLSNEEIAKRLNISKRTVENYLSAALKDIRDMLGSVIVFFI